MEHTPTPWRNGGNGGIYGMLPRMDCIEYVLREGERCIVSTPFVQFAPDWYRKLEDGNIEYIVKAVNAHDRLVKVLQEVRHSIASEDLFYLPGCQKARQNIQQVLEDLEKEMKDERD